MSLSEPVSAFSAIDVTCGFIQSSNGEFYINSFTMVQPQGGDGYVVIITSSSNTSIAQMALEISGSEKDISVASTNVGMKIFRVVGHR